MADYKVDVVVNVQDEKLKALKTELQTLTSGKKKVAVDIDTSKANTSVNSLGKRVDSIKNKFNNLTYANSFDKLANDFTKVYTNSESAKTGLNNVWSAYERLCAAMKSGDDIAIVAAATEYENILKRTTNQLKTAERAQKSYSSSVKLNFDKMKLSNKMDLWLKNNSNATETFGKKIEGLKAKLASCDSISLGNVKKEFETLTMQAELAGKTGLNVKDSLIRQFKRYGTYLVSSFGLMGAVQGLQQMYQNVKEVDTAMTELKRVTDLSVNQYSDLYSELTVSAREYGTTLSDIISATADWSRAGFDPSIAKGLAEVTTMYQHIADVDYQTAFENLQTAYKGFEDELTNSFGQDKVAAVSYIGDILNELDNNFAVTAEGVGEALKRSASALNIAGNSIQETAGMVTGITEVTQDPEKAGNALKVLSMRLRGMKGELEELGEDVDSNVSNLSKMQGQILKLTHGKVNIFNDVGEFKSTYEIMQGIAEVYDKLSTTEQADLLETIAGKHRANDVAALISNWGKVKDAVVSATNATGSAEREHAKYVDSIEGRLNTLTSVWQTFSNEFLNTDFVKGAVSALSSILDILTKIIDKIGGLGTVGIFGGLIYGLKNFKDLKSIFSDLHGAFSGGIKSLGDFGAAAKLTAGSVFTSFSRVVAGVGLVTGVIAAGVSLYKQEQERLRKIRQETIDTSNAFNESFGSFEQVYIKYADRTALTVDEESELKNAIDGTVSALGDKAGALKDNIGASNEYFQNLDKIAKAEAEQAKIVATSARQAAEVNMEKASKNWWATGRSNFDFKFANVSEDEYKEIEDLIKQAQTLGYTKSNYRIGTRPSATGNMWFGFDENDSLDTTISKLNLVEQMRDRLASSGDVDNQQYKDMTSTLEEMSTYVDEIVKQTYNEAKATYQMNNGVATTADKFYEMREAVLDAAGATTSVREAVGELMNQEYADIFDLSSVEAQIDYIKSVTKDVKVEAGSNFDTGEKYYENAVSDDDIKTFETFLNVKTSLNNGECTVGEYNKALEDANEAISWIADEDTKNFLRVQLGLELDAEGNLKDEVSQLRDKLIRDLQNDGEGVSADVAESIADSLSKTELKAAIDIVADGELDLKNLDVNKFNKEVRKQARINEAMNFTIDVKGETESIEALNTALQESRSATGLTAESIDALKGRYQSLADYDAATLFQETANGITLNAEELNKLNSEYVNLQKNEIMNGKDGKLDVLKDRYDELTDKIREETDAATKAKYINEREDIRGKIVELAEYATQLDALTSSYNEWQNAEAAGNDRDLYASVYSAQENIKKELDNGWIDDGTREYFQLIWGEDKWNGAGKSISDYRKQWNTLDDTIKGTSYSIQDFFKVNDDGELTSEGIFNFFDAVGQKQKELGEDWIQYDKNGNMKSFNFGVDGDKAIADALGISEELVQIFLRASQDAGFVVNFDGTYTQLADLQNEAKAAMNTLNETFGTEYSFDFNSNSLTSLQEDLKEAKGILNDEKFWNHDKAGNRTTFNFKAEGAEEVMTIVSTLQASIDNLDNKYIGLTVEDESFEEPLQKLQDYETKTAELNQLELNPKANTEDIEKLQGDLQEIAEYFAGDTLSDDTKIKMGIELDDTPEEIKKKIESGEIKIPTTLDLQTNMNETLEDLRDLSLLNSGLLDEEQEHKIKVKLGLEVDDEEANKDAEEANTEIQEKFSNFSADNDVDVDVNANVEGDQDVGALIEHLGQLDDTQIQAIANVIGTVDVETLQGAIGKLDDKTVQAIAEALGKGDVEGLKTALLNIPDKKVAKAIAKAFGYDSVEELANAVGGLDSKTVKAVAKAFGIKDVKSLKSVVNSLKPKTVKAIAKAIGEGNVKSLIKTIANLKDKTVTIKQVTKKIVETASSAGKKAAGKRTGSNLSPAEGTANAEGSAFAHGTTGRAFIRGNWGTKDDGVALGGELGQELVVRDGRWFTIGDNGAEFFKYKKNDIIFNAGQTKQLFEQGKIIGGRTRGMIANANGTAFAGGTAFAKGKNNSNAEIAWEMEKAKSWFAGITDAQVKKLGYKNIRTVKQFFNAIKNGTIDPTFGNINMDNREIITWNKKNKKKYKKALMSWDEGDGTWYSNVDSSSYDTVHGGSGRFGVNIDGKGVEVAYSPIVVDENGKITKILSKNGLNSYIENILEQAYDADGKFKQSTILNLDNLHIIAGVDTSKNYGKTGLGNSAVTKGMLMHFSGKYGAIQQAKNKSKYDGSAFANGSKDEISLGGESGTEILVRDGRWYTIGDDGAEFFGHKKNDIIFNAQQSKQLLEKGKITQGNGRGKTLASGTAFSDGLIPDDVWDDDSSSDGSNKKKSSSSDKKFKESLDWIEIKIDRIERAISKLNVTVDSTYTSWGTRNAKIKENIKNVTSEINAQVKAQKNAAKRYQQEANKVKFSSNKKKDAAYKAKLDAGKIDISTITNEDLKDKIDEYLKWHEKSLDAQKKALDLEEDRKAYYAQLFSNIQSEYESQLGIIEFRKNMIEESISQQEAMGHIVSTGYYDGLIANTNANKAKLEQEKKALKDQLNQNVKKGKIEKYSEEWYKEIEAINGVTQAIKEADTQLLEYEKNKREINWQYMDLLHDKISKITDESEFLIELMSNDKLYEDNGQLTKEGQATMGLRTVNYGTYMEQAKQYAKDIVDLRAELAKDPYNQDAQDKLDEYIEKQREAILAAEQEKDAIKDLVEEGIQTELDALQELIDKKTEALDAQKDLYDYQKKVKDQTKEIASLEKQMAAYQNDNSEEAKAKIQELKVSLEDAKADLEDTEYDKYISDQKEMLDDLYDEYEEILNQRLDNVDALMNDMIAATNQNTSTIKKTLEDETKSVGTSLTTTMTNIWSEPNGPVSGYVNGINTSVNGVTEAVKAIGTAITKMRNDLDEDAETDVANDNGASAGGLPEEGSPTTPATPTTPVAPATPVTPATTQGDGKAKVGDKVTFANGKYHAASDGSGATGSAYLNKNVYIVKVKSGAKYPYLIGTKKGNVNDSLGWVKLSQLKGYATGKRNLLSDEFALTQENGAEMIVRPSDGAILTPLAKGDSVLNAAASGNIWDMANNPADFIKNNLGIDAVDTAIGNSGQSVYNQTIENVVFDFKNVKNYDQMLAAMQKDKNFERLINAMTIDQVAGKSKLGKGKAIR